MDSCMEMDGTPMCMDMGGDDSGGMEDMDMDMDMDMDGD
jgi:hypothetical protein